MRNEGERGKGGREKIEETRLFPKNCCFKGLDNAGKLKIALPSKSLLLTHGNTQRKEKSGLIRSYFDHRSESMEKFVFLKAFFPCLVTLCTLMALKCLES